MRVALPEPSADDGAHSERLAAVIRAEIAAAGGLLDFSRFMELALYAPGLGYYSAGAVKFGAAGDFVTAPELGCLFARCLARAVAASLRESPGDIVELGPGSGALAAELLLELERLDALPRRYRLLERSADLRERQRRRLARDCPHLHNAVEWLDAPPAQSWRGVLLANEVVDALPVRLFALHAEGLQVRGVALAGDGAFAWGERPADAQLLAAFHDNVRVDLTALPRPYLSEVRPLLAPWLCEVTRSLEHGAAWFIDYGHATAEFYSPQRRAGTLRCHYRHRLHDDPLRWPGLQDITASVDFGALATAATAAGFVYTGDVAQARFLIDAGIDAVFAQAQAHAVSEAERYRLAQEAKQLMLPGAMGDAFRVATLQR